jgi:hypothetical protein
MSSMDTGGIQRVINRRHQEWFDERDRDRTARTAVPDSDPRGRFRRLRELVAVAAGRASGTWRRPDRQTAPGDPARSIPDSGSARPRGGWDQEAAAEPFGGMAP